MRKLAMLLLLAACTSDPELIYVGTDRDAVMCEPEPETTDPLPDQTVCMGSGLTYDCALDQMTYQCELRPVPSVR